MRTQLRRLFAPLALGVAGGCAPSVADVNGSVSHNGKRMVWGGVALVAADGSAHQGTIGTDGRFSIPKVPLGPAKLGVSTFDPNPKGPDKERRWKSPDLPAGAWFPISDKFADPQKSGLTAEIRDGVPVDLDLK